MPVTECKRRRLVIPQTLPMKLRFPVRIHIYILLAPAVVGGATVFTLFSMHFLHQYEPDVASLTVISAKYVNTKILH